MIATACAVYDHEAVITSAIFTVSGTITLLAYCMFKKEVLAIKEGILISCSYYVIACGIYGGIFSNDFLMIFAITC